MPTPPPTRTTATPSRSPSPSKGSPSGGSPSRSEGSNDAGQLGTVRKTLRLLQEFSYAEPVLGVSELSRRLGMGKSTVHRILSTLAAEGFVQKTPDDRYRLGLRLYELGQVTVNSLELREVAHIPLERLRTESGETAHLAVLEGADVVYLERFESQSTLRLFSRLGRRMPAHATSSGKVLLAFGEVADLQAVLERGLRRLAPRTITTRAGLTDALAKARTDGYAVSIDESEAGVVSAAAPVFGHDGTCLAAVSIAGPGIRLRPDELPRYVRMVRRSAMEVSQGMGFLSRTRG